MGNRPYAVSGLPTHFLTITIPIRIARFTFVCYTLKKLFTAQGTDVSGNGRVQVRVVEHVPTGDPGRKDLLGLLGDWENILYVVDGETLALYQSLGYFGDAVSLGDGRWAAVNDAPFPLFTLEEYSAYGYTQEQIDESNEYMLAEHARLVAEGAAIVQSLSS